MLQCNSTVEDAAKLKQAYDDLTNFIESVEKTSEKLGKEYKISKFILDAHRCLREVLYGE